MLDHFCLLLTMVHFHLSLLKLQLQPLSFLLQHNRLFLQAIHILFQLPYCLAYLLLRPRCCCRLSARSRSRATRLAAAARRPIRAGEDV